MDDFIKFWNESGWVANLVTVLLGFITIIGGLYSAGKAIKKFLGRRNDCSNVLSILKNKSTEVNKESLKK